MATNKKTELEKCFFKNFFSRNFFLFPEINFFFDIGNNPMSRKKHVYLVMRGLNIYACAHLTEEKHSGLTVRLAS